jgi:protein-(glutamine-N5) methyltransferase, release factor-specific
MISSEILHSFSHTLSAARIDDASMEAELLLCHVLGICRTQLYTESERLLTSVEISHLGHLIQRRVLHEPAVYILGRCEFCGTDFYIDHRVFIPRPETELLVEKTIEFACHLSSSRNQLTIADIGTGSGVIAISLALALPQTRIYATDISALALQVAKINCQRHKLDSRIELLQGNLVEPLSEPVDIVVANLPYITDCELRILSPEIINFEPMIALAGGEDGLDKIRDLLAQIPGRIRPGGCLLMEVGQGQSEVVTSLINSCFPHANIEVTADLSGIDRVVRVIL